MTESLSTAPTTLGTTEWIKAHLERMDPSPRPRRYPGADNDPTQPGTPT